jgi:putative aldouronate transport system permease protein
MDTLVKKGFKKQTMKRLMPLYLMALPGLIYIVINNYLPMAGLVVAFKDFNYMDGIFHSPWNGVDNFEYLFGTSTSWIITRNTILYNMAFIVLNTVAGVGTAVLLNEIRKKLSIKVFQMAIMLPYLLSIIIVSYLTYAFFNTDTGFLNTQLLAAAGEEPVSWYSDPKYWPWILLFVNTLKNFGFLGLIYYASILSISKDYYEAAALDGATKYQQLRYITLPFLKSIVIMMVLLAVGRMFYSDFGLFYHVPMDSGALYNVTSTLDTFVYRSLIKLGDVGMAAAAGLYQSIVGFILILAVNLIVRKISPEDALF